MEVPAEVVEYFEVVVEEGNCVFVCFESVLRRGYLHSVRFVV